MAQSPYQRHAHFQEEAEEDSGEESSPGLQFQSRRLRSDTIRHSAPTPEVGNTLNPDAPADGTQPTPSKPVPIVGSTNILDLHQVTRAGVLGRGGLKNEHDCVPKAAQDARPSIMNSPETSRRQKVRMNSTPVSVSMPVMLQEDDMKITEGSPESAANPTRPQRSINSQRASWSSDQELNLSEKVQRGGPTSQIANAQNSGEVAGEKPVSLHDKSDPAASSANSRTPKWLIEMYNRTKASRRVSWIVPTVTDYNLMKPVIRSSVSAWLGLVFLLINPILRVEGQSAFFSVVVAFIAPPNLPFIQAMEQIVYLWVFVGLAWVWVIICAACISAVRTNDVNPAFLAQVEHRYAGLKATNPEQYQRRIVSICRGSSVG